MRKNRENPDKEFKGTFNVRIPPELHKKAALEAAKQNITLNQYVIQAIKQSFETKEPQAIIYIPNKINHLDWSNDAGTAAFEINDTPVWSKKERFIYAGN